MSFRFISSNSFPDNSPYNNLSINTQTIFYQEQSISGEAET